MAQPMDVCDRKHVMMILQWNDPLIVVKMLMYGYGGLLDRRRCREETKDGCVRIFGTITCLLEQKAVVLGHVQ